MVPAVTRTPSARMNSDDSAHKGKALPERRMQEDPKGFDVVLNNHVKALDAIAEESETFCHSLLEAPPTAGL